MSMNSSSQTPLTLRQPPSQLDEWDDWAKSFEECVSLPPGSIGIPLSHIILEQEQPQLLPKATNNKNFISMAKLAGKTFKTDSEKVHLCSLPVLAKHSEALLIVKGTGADTRCRGQDWLALI